MKNRKLRLKALKMALWVLPIAIVGGWLTGVYLMEHSDEAMKALILSQVGNEKILYVITAVQSAVFAFVAAFLGYFLANSLGLVRNFRFEKSILKRVVPVIVVLGLVFTLDYFIFGSVIPEVAADYEKGISINYLLTSLLYGGVIEEVLLRWFVMSLLAWIFWKLLAKRYAKDDIPDMVFIAANLLSAFLFAAGHLPATITLFGGLNALILLRCFLLNGGFAVLFGRYYRKYGIQYAILAHFGLHLISKVILMLVI